MMDELFRDLIVRELDDIKTKIEDSDRKDLLSSVSFLKDGVTFLNLSQDESTDGETNSYPQEQKEDISQAEASTAMVVAGSSSVSNEACSLSFTEENRKSNLASEKRFASAMLSFQEANKEATKAFSNEALKIEDRIMATKLRVISRILEYLQDPDAAAVTCMVYLEELNSMPAVRRMFFVQLEGGMKSLFNKKKRFENVMSVTVINCVLFNFTKKFTKMGASLSHWPSIELGKRSYNPVIVLNRRMLAELEKSGVQPPNKLTLINKDIVIDFSFVLAVNSKGEIIFARMRSNATDIMKITTAGEVQLFCRLPPEETETNGFKILSLAIDREDNVYILTWCDNVHHNKLFVYDAKGNMKHVCHNKFNYSCTIAITKDKKIITHDKEMHVCDSSGELKYIFPTPEERDVHFLSISDKNETIAAGRFTQFVYIYTEEGKVERKLKVTAKDDIVVRGVAFNHVTKEVLVLTQSFVSCESCISSYSTTGEKREIMRLPFVCDCRQLTSHPSGPVAVVCSQTVFYIQ